MLTNHVFRTSLSSSVIHFNLRTLQNHLTISGNTSDQDSDRETDPPVKTVDKTSARSGKRDAPKASPIEPLSERNTNDRGSGERGSGERGRGGRGRGRGGFTGSEEGMNKSL